MQQEHCKNCTIHFAGGGSYDSTTCVKGDSCPCHKSPLLDKFDKDFDEKFCTLKYGNGSSHGGGKSAWLAPKENVSILDIKSLAHSHLEEAYKLGHQSNLERLIVEKFGDKKIFMLQKMSNPVCWNALTSDDGLIAKEGSTPTEAVENLIKALEKK